MDIRQKIAQIEGAEHLFEILDVEFDLRVLAVRRLSILKRFGILVAEIEASGSPPATEEDRRARYRQALVTAYDKHARLLVAEPSPFAGVQAGLVQLRRKPPVEA